MAKTSKRPTSTLRSSQNKQHKQRKVVRRTSMSGSWTWIGIILGAVVLIVGVLLYVYFNNGNTGDIVASDPVVFNAVTHVDTTLLEQVGTGNAQSSLQATKGSPALLTGSTGKPEFFYVGGEYCPYCAAQRWAVVVALSRFGTFGPLQQTHSSEQNLATFTFRNSTYTSQYVDFVAKEIEDNQGNKLDTLTSQQQQNFNTYDSPPYMQTSGSIPFINIANRYVSSGSYYLPDTLTDLSWQDIVTQMKNPDTTVSKGILGSANYLTAAICTSTQNEPATVCNADYMQQIEKTVGTSATS